jgi:hypothetical protein
MHVIYRHACHLPSSCRVRSAINLKPCCSLNAARSLFLLLAAAQTSQHADVMVGPWGFARCEEFLGRAQSGSLAAFTKGLGLTSPDNREQAASPNYENQGMNPGCTGSEESSSKKRSGATMAESFPVLDFRSVWQNRANDIIAARAKSRVAHGTRDIRASGDEVEMPARSLFRENLPSTYYVGLGHVVDYGMRVSPQYDIIVAETGAGPLVHRLENGTEYLAYESVYAIGEIKSGYRKSDKPVEQFADNVRNMKARLQRKTYPLRASIRAGSPGSGRFDLAAAYANPLFSFMLFADSGDFSAEDIGGFYMSTPPSDLPNIVCLLDAGVLLNMTVFRTDDGSLFPYQINTIPEFNNKTPMPENRWCFLQMGPEEFRAGANLATLYYLLHGHLSSCQLSRPSMTAYMSLILKDKSGVVFE